MADDLRLRVLEKQESSGKSQNVTEWEPSAQFSCQNQNFVKTGEKHLQNRN